jgi:hypothetical protein
MNGCPRHGLEFLKVLQRRCNHSAFNDYHWTRSDYSTVMCFSPIHCTFNLRTKASYVAGLPDATDSDLGIRR